MEYDVIIIGAGSVGMATGFYLSKQGVKVLLLDEYNPPHANGSHHGETRIIRHAYGEGKHYVELALRSQQLWEELAAVSNEEVFICTGVVNIGKEDSPFMQGVLESVESYHLPVERLTGEEMAARWEGWEPPKDYIAIYEKTSGVLKSEACIRQYQKGVIRNGGDVKANERIQAILHETERVQVTTVNGKFSAKQLLITAGAGTNQVLSHLGKQLPLSTVRKTFSWFDHPQHLFDEKTYPAFTCTTDLGIYYGFPNIDGTGVKIGRHDGGIERDVLEEIAPFGSFSIDEAEVVQFAHTFMTKQLAHRIGLPCTYTLSPDNDFIIDRLPGFSRIKIACGFSGHGFKFSSGLGEALSELLINEKSDIDLTPFRLKRLL